MKISNNANLRSLNTFGMDVRANYLAELNVAHELHLAQDLCEKENLPLLILGGGSNILFLKDVSAVVLLNRLRGIETLEQNDTHVWVKAAAGENWHTFVLDCISNNYGGLENLSLIPGNVGASPMQNIGAYGVEIKDHFHSLEAIHLKTGITKTFSVHECQFGYRESVFKQAEKGQWLITSVTFKLSKKDHQLQTGYGAIMEELELMKINTPSIKSISDAVIRIRQSKLPNPSEIGNAGSFFKNPVVETSLVETIRSNYTDVVAYPAGDGKMKLAAGWLIEKAGWKGFRRGDAGVHARQALVLVNYGNATGTDIWQLSSDIVEDVFTKFGVELEREVNIG
jgi:UDP-N-acetylmuramate dehydrogenase